MLLPAGRLLFCCRSVCQLDKQGCSQLSSFSLRISFSSWSLILIFPFSPRVISFTDGARSLVVCIKLLFNVAFFFTFLEVSRSAHFNACRPPLSRHHRRIRILHFYRERKRRDGTISTVLRLTIFRKMITLITPWKFVLKLGGVLLRSKECLTVFRCSLCNNFA